MSAITALFAGVPVSDLDASLDWYTRFFGRTPDLRVGDEILWDVDEHATLFIEPNAAHVGAGRITMAVTGLDALLVKIPDPDGNAIAFAEPPDAI
jgi:catechol 2,3-dioxygenase-like lactoylglutathione lyase family enzyme